MGDSALQYGTVKSGGRLRWRWVGGAAALLAAFLAAGCNHSAPPARGPKTVEVVVTQPITDEVTDYQDFTGRLNAVKSVEIRARVTGYVSDVPFKEGDRVNEGDLLFQIDPRPYQADLNQAKANLTLAEAERNVQEKNANRAARLLPGQAIAREDYDTIVATWEKSRATVEAMKAAQDRAQLYVKFTQVTAPVSGRISRRYVDPGNLVTADNTILTSIVTEDPMYAYFDVDERTYLDLLESAAPGRTSWLAGLRFPVLMSLANENKSGAFVFARSGTIDFVDNQVNANTGTIRMRGTFKNPTGSLKAGLFVRIRLPIGTPYKAILISDEALLSDQGRKYVYVLNDRDEVEYRPVKIGQAIKGLRVIKAPEKGQEGKEGLSEGDRVIVSGMQQVRPKMQVQVKVQDPPSRPSQETGNQEAKETGRQGDKTRSGG